jgi:hypothetical protein
VVVALVAFVCAVLVGSAGAASAGGGHLPFFSLMDKKVAVSKLPFELRISLQGFPGSHRRPRIRGPVWFGEVQRSGVIVSAAGTRRQICTWESRDGGRDGGSGGCNTPKAVRELRDFSVSSCGKGPPRHFRISTLVPNGVAGLEIQREDGSIGRTVPVVDNTVAFTIGREDFTMQGVGDAAAERLERSLPLAAVDEAADKRPGCTSYFFAEAKKDAGE